MESVGQLGIYACDFLGVCDFVVIAGETRVVRVFIYLPKLLEPPLLRQYPMCGFASFFQLPLLAMGLCL